MKLNAWEMMEICKCAKRAGDVAPIYALLMGLHDKALHEATSKEDAVRAIKLYALALRDTYFEVLS